MIEFLLDENLPFALINFLEEKGYLVSHIKKIGMSGIRNGEVYKLAEQNKSWLITRDADSESYYKFKSYDVGGVIVLKLSVTRTQYLLDIIKKFLDGHKDKFSRKHLIIIDDSEIKIYD